MATPIVTESLAATPTSTPYVIVKEKPMAVEKIIEVEKKGNLSPTPVFPLIDDKNVAINPNQITIKRIIDGDTIEVQLPTGLRDTVRLIGVDTPETSKSNSADEYEGITDVACLDMWGTKATEFTESYLLEATLNQYSVVLESDPLTGQRGYYNRLLAYLIVNDIDFNAILIRNGYARVYIEESFSTVSEYLLLQKSARDNNLGLWSCRAKPLIKLNEVIRRTETPSVSKLESPVTECDPSYPNVCIPPYPPDLDCGEIPYKRFIVLPPDLHRFDGDKNGIGCQS